MVLKTDDRLLPRVRDPVDALVRVPGSKSVANRALLLAALADGRSELRDVPEGEIWGGSPAIPIRQWHRQTTALARMVTL